MTDTFDAWRANSPFYNESHEALAQSLRRFVDREVSPYIDQWEEAREIPREFQRKAGEAGILGLMFPEELGGVSEGFDVFHQLTQLEALARPGAGGVHASLLTHGVALHPIVLMGSEELKQRVVPDVLAGKKIISLGVTEPSGGSDVANLKTRAEKRGDKYIVNGSKTFISNAMRADYFTVAVRTGGPGMGGISLLLMEPSMKGFARTKLEKMGWHSSDTATLYFEDVEVPAENLIGPEAGGFIKIMETFNGERLFAAQQCTSMSRVCLEEAVEWAKQRETFGKKLGEHQVIRSKLADMLRQIEATQAWIDLCAWQYKNGTVRPADLALLKVQATLSFEKVARDAAQVLGGASFLRGSKIERIYREVRVLSIGGGSEEIMLDLAGRQLKYG